MSQKAQNQISKPPKSFFITQSYFLIGQGPALVAMYALAASRFAAARFPLKQEYSPRHADRLVVTGPVNRRYRPVVARLAAQLAWPGCVIHLDGLPLKMKLARAGYLQPAGNREASNASFKEPLSHLVVSSDPSGIIDTLHSTFTSSLSLPSQPVYLEEGETGPGTLVPLRSPEEKELATEDLTLSLGPAHPAVYGPLRLVLTLDGEQVAAAIADPGYAHRGIEKLAQGQEPRAALAFGGALDALAPLAGTMAVTLALEKMWLSDNEKLPPRAGFLRLIALELERIASHLFAHSILLKTLALDGPANKVLDLYAEVTGSIKLVCGDSPSSFIIPGGVQKDLNTESTSVLSRVLRQVQSWIRREVGPPANSVSNRLFQYTLKSRLAGQGVLGLNEAVELGFTGPNLRASSSALDWRASQSLAKSGLPYRELDFKPGSAFSTRSQDEDGGDAYSRFRQRTLEIAASAELVEQALKNLPPGSTRLKAEPDQSFMPRRIREGNFGPGEAGGIVESPRGVLEARLALTIDSGGKVIIERLHFRSPSWPHFQALPGLITGARLPDALVIINSLDIAPDEAER